MNRRLVSSASHPSDSVDLMPGSKIAQYVRHAAMVDVPRPVVIFGFDTQTCGDFPSCTAPKHPLWTPWPCPKCRAQAGPRNTSHNDQMSFGVALKQSRWSTLILQSFSSNFLSLLFQQLGIREYVVLWCLDLCSLCARCSQPVTAQVAIGSIDVSMTSVRSQCPCQVDSISIECIWLLVITWHDMIRHDMSWYVLICPDMSWYVMI